MLGKNIGRWMRGLLLAGATLALVGCGGGGGGCTDAFGGGCAAPDDGAPTATPVAKLSLNLSALSINNSGSETITATVTATNANNQVMGETPVVLSVDGGAQIAVAGSATDADGKLAGTVSIGDDRSNRAVTVTASANAGALTATKTFQIVGAKLTATAVPAVLTPAQKGEVKYRLLDANANPMTGAPILVTGPGGVETSGQTGNNGEYDYSYTAPANTGDLAIRASAGGEQSEVTVLVQAADGGGIPPVNSAQQTIRSASVSANPSVVAVNTASTNNQSQIRVLFLTDGNAPVRNMRVRFDLAGDPNSVGGTFTTGSNIVYSDANGVATTSYVPGSRSGPTDGVTVRACWDYVDFTTCNPAQAVTTTLTVIADPVSVTIGTNNLIAKGASDLTYVKRYVVQVVDSSGLAKPDVAISPSVDLVRYIKGRYQVVGDAWAKVSPITNCDNEDLNRNNTSETYADGWVEDANGVPPPAPPPPLEPRPLPRPPALEPRKSDVAVSFEGSSRTNSSGQVVIKIEYPQDIGSWVEFNLLVAASGVSATEGRANYNGVLPVPADAVKDKDVPPPFVTSPYGVEKGFNEREGETGLKTYTTPDGKKHQLCTNPN